MKQTPSQTVGPFYAIGLTNRKMNVLATDATQGQRIRIEGRVFDGDGKPVPDAMVEIWQANAYGRYHHPEDKQEK
ncbi:MAG TPA: protocatechuate 3,4-dioxygenase subunit alpha, partial [Methylomirabilota bacterium]|nr:protocatechuate 3,4-dioxygenase subunit alpha [Methylomirabilota bacterium]